MTAPAANGPHRPRGAARPLSVAAAAGAGAGAVVALVLVLAGRAGPPPAAATAPAPAAPAAAAPQSSLSESRRTAIVAAADRVGHAVVAISASSTQQANPYAGTVWEDFFPLLRQPRPVQSLGSGFVFSDEGYILTNDHVVEGAESVRVTLMDGREYAAQIVGADPTTDLAVLRVEASDLPVAPLGSSDDLLIGEWALAIGNPFAPLLGDANPSVTVGVVSALHRDVRPVPGQEQIWTDMIQTDASINPGNSGGPLVNAAGEVVGVNSFIFSRTGGSIGIGFAIPINRARRIADDLVRFGEVRVAWTGVHVADSAADGGSDGAAVTVIRVDPGSPAETAGIRPGQGLVSARGRRVLSALDWEGRRVELRPGEAVELEILRDGRRERVVLTPSQDPLTAAPQSEGPLGLRLTALTPALRSYLAVRAESGILVTAVAAGSPAQNIGLEEGDVLLAVNDQRVDDVDAAVELLDSVAGRGRSSLIWERSGQLFRWEG